MKQRCDCALRAHITEHFRETRKRLGLTQAQFAELLMMDAHSYAAMENGENCCCTLTFIFYLVFFCKDVNLFVDDLQRIIIDNFSGD